MPRAWIALAVGMALVGVIAFLAWPSPGPLPDSDLRIVRGPDAAATPPPLRGGSLGDVAYHRAQQVPAKRPGAMLHGTVRWDSGAAVPGAEVTLVDEVGDVVSEVRTDDSGEYTLEDPGLIGSEVQVTEPTGDAHRRELAPLRSGEDRAFDVVLGEQREVVGWVLDASGQPQPGVSVSATWEAANSTWRAVTDFGGGFTFVDVPATPLRVTADGGDLGLASARLARSDATRREVTLVLEPTGTILVRASPEVAKLGAVTIRCFSSTAHGEDGMWSDDLRVGDGGVPDGVIDPAADATVPIDDATMPIDGPIDEAPTDDASHSEPSMVEVEAMLGNALRGWDATDPEASLVRMALDLARAHPRMEAEMRREMGAQFPDLLDGSLEQLAQAAADKVMEEEPRVLDMMGLAALKVQEGHSPMEAFMLAEQESRAAASPDESAAHPPEAVAEDVPPADFSPDEAAVDEMHDAEGVANAEYDLGEHYVDGAPDDYSERVEALRKLTGIDTIGLGDEPRSIVASGRFFDPIPVRGAFEYQVSVRTGDGYELVCGTVFVAAGEEVEVPCGGAGPAVLEGRVIDPRGAPVAGAMVEVFVDEPRIAYTDANGRYAIEVSIASAQLLTVTASDTDGTVWAQRRQQNALPFARTQVPDLVARREGETPEHRLTTPFGGVGASIELSNEGILLAHLFADGPLAMAGAEPGDVIVRVGEELGASLSVDDALTMLRGEAGSEVDLTLRSAAGELYELLLTRGTVDPTIGTEPGDR